MVERTYRLSGGFVRCVREPGRYGDGRGGYGLSLLVKPRAHGQLSKTWAQRLQVNGRPVHIGLGPYPVVTLEAARELAIDNARAVRSGVNPLAERTRRAGIPTFAELAESAMAELRDTWRNAKTGKLWQSRLSAYVYPVIGELPVNAITTAHVHDVLSPIADKRDTARKVAGHVRAVMEYAERRGYRDDSPALNVSAALPKSNGHTEHHKALAAAEVPATLAAIGTANVYEPVKLALRLLTLTAARSNEVRGMTWAEIDMDARTWTVPADRMKGNRTHRVPLSDAALDVLNRASAIAMSSELVFPAPRGGKLTDYSLSRVFSELGIGGTVHGMRSTFRDWAAESGVEHDAAELALAHVEGSSVVKAYKRTDLYERRVPVMAEWAEYVTAC